MKKQRFEWNTYDVKTKGYDIGIVADGSDEFLGLGMLCPDDDFPGQYLVKIKLDKELLKKLEKHNDKRISI